MAVRTACPRCGKRFSAPEDYLGKKEACPKCGYRFVLRTAEEEKREREKEEALKKSKEEDRRKLELIERQEQQNKLQASRPYYERYQTGIQAVRHYNPNAPSRFLRLRALSDLLILAAYLVVMLSLVGAGLTVYLKIEGIITSIAALLVGLVAWGLFGMIAYLLLKYIGEVAFLAADFGDLQNDLVQLLLDIRENTDRDRSGDDETPGGDGVSL